MSTHSRAMARSRSSSRQRPPGSSQGKRSNPPSIHCNQCLKSLTTTCFLCACDCIFCEECTYAHFEANSDCPACGRTLTENDFVELVVADPTPSSNNTDATKKQTLQSLFTKKSNQSSTLPYSDLCHSLVRQIDMAKSSSKFLLKQMLVNNNIQAQKMSRLARAYEEAKAENTRIKQTSSSERLSLEQVVAQLKTELQAKDKMIAQFQRHHSSKVPPSSSGSHGSNHRQESRARSATQEKTPRQEPPLRGFMMQQQAQQKDVQTYQSLSNRAPPMRQGMAGRVSSSAPNSSHGGHFAIRGRQQPTITPMQQRPFSSAHSTGSGSVGHAIRDLSVSAGYKFTSQHMNKRRRGPSSSSSGGRRQGTSLYSAPMSPSTAFTLNNGMGGAARYSNLGPSHSFHR